jgi:hypothetical protein
MQTSAHTLAKIAQDFRDDAVRYANGADRVRGLSPEQASAAALRLSARYASRAAQAARTDAPFAAWCARTDAQIGA